ncbi:hypothetical protein CLD22_12185 [Rubrivivax gelatinosus]|nr:hypothetical protein [Rubrivivax gelatinosus]
MVSVPDPAATTSQAALSARWKPWAWLGEWWPRARPWALAALGLVFVLVIVAALGSLLHEVRYAEVLVAIKATPQRDVVLALLFTAASFLALTGYDASALRHAGAQVRPGTVMLTSFVAYALGNTIGLGPLTGGAVRMRLYGAAGVEPAKITRAIVFNAAAFFLGITAFGALGLLWAADLVAPQLHLPALLLRAGALLALAALAGFVVLCARQRVLRLGRWSMRLPQAGLALRQLAIGGVELACSAAVLWWLLPAGALPLASFVAFYAVAIAASIVSHVPGGIGVFEAVMLAALGPQVPVQEVLGALLLYRGIYHVLPLVAAAAVLALYELRAGVAAPVGRMAVHLSPQLLAALAVVGGVWLLVSGVTPQSDEAQQLLALRVPLPLVEASHFLGSIAGLGLLIVARGLLHRLDAAWAAALLLSLLATVLAWPKGIALNEALLLGTLATLLLISRRQFDRRSSLFAERLEPEWLLALAGVVAGCIGVLFFAYQEVNYANRLWWQFEFDAQAPRSLRALLAVTLACLGFSAWQLLLPTAGDAARPTPAELERAAAISRDSSSAVSQFALTGDKHLMFSDSGRSFLMFGKQARSWIALDGPFGDAAEAPELVWRFVETASAHGGRAAFYQVRPASLPMFLDCGLQAFKLGEYASVPLHDFSLRGVKRADLRSAINRAQREGLAFEVLDGAAVAHEIDALRAVSDAWLAGQRTREKGFSVGSFDPAWLQRTPVAVVRRDGAIVAFANLLVTARHEDATIDLMRHRPDAPPGTMDYLFAQLMLHLQAEGFARFGLGMAPMAGMAERRRAPRWQRVGRLLFEHGERFYNFRGLFRFKDKFAPEWEARYLVAPGGLAPMFVMIDVAALIGGGAKGVLTK